MFQDYTGITQDGHTLADLFDDGTIQLTEIKKGAFRPVFTFYTKHFDETYELLRMFPVTIIPVGLSLLRTAMEHKNMQLPPHYQMHNECDLAIEFSLDDFDPYHIFYNVPVPRKVHQQLAKADYVAKDFSIVLQSKSGQLFGKSQKAVIERSYHPYIIDWIGTLGFVFNLRRSANSEQYIKGLIKILLTHLAEHGYATGIFGEMGYLHRLIEDWHMAIQCYRTEIKANLTSNGILGFGAVRVLSNLGVVHKKLGNIEQAQDYFTLALSLNPNYFESLVSLAGIIDDPWTILSCLARAYRIRPGFPIFPELFDNIGQKLGASGSVVARKIESESPKVNLLTSPKKLKLESAAAILGRIEL